MSPVQSPYKSRVTLNLFLSQDFFFFFKEFILPRIEGKNAGG